jgi:hypothetical protein
MNVAAIHRRDPHSLHRFRGILTERPSGRESINFRLATFLPGLRDGAIPMPRGFNSRINHFSADLIELTVE